MTASGTGMETTTLLRENPLFSPLQHPLKEKGLSVYKINTSSEGDIDGAERVIQKLLQENKGRLFATFDTKTEPLRQKLITQNYLIINTKVREAASLSFAANPLHHPDLAADERDAFTGTPLQNPIWCQKGHALEKERARHFVAHKQENVCPSGSSAHLISEGEQLPNVDVILQLFIRLKMHLGIDIRKQGENPLFTICATAGRQVISIAETLNATAKVGQAVKIGSTVATGAGPIAASKSSSLAIPVAGAFLGLGLGLYRFTQGQWNRGVGEMAAGVFSCWPGPGTAVSLAITGGVIAGDLFAEPDVSTKDKTLDQLYRFLGIDVKKTPNPSQDDVDRISKQFIDSIQEHNGSPQYPNKITTGLVNAINNIKEHIYTQRGWVSGAAASDS